MVLPICPYWGCANLDLPARPKSKCALLANVSTFKVSFYPYRILTGRLPIYRHGHNCRFMTSIASGTYHFPGSTQKAVIAPVAASNCQRHSGPAGKEGILPVSEVQVIWPVCARTFPLTRRKHFCSHGFAMMLWPFRQIHKTRRSRLTPTALGLDPSLRTGVEAQTARLRPSLQPVTNIRRSEVATGEALFLSCKVLGRNLTKLFHVKHFWNDSN